ncbi:MAG TPA: hypothetical protein ENL45_00775 [Candidatus Woesearchaeota archaeon]|nr:hypothetical protein [Candidatus Woesearchaeota archaeon]
MLYLRKKSIFLFLIFLFSFCFSAMVRADRTNLTITSESEIEIFSGYVDVYISLLSGTGNLSGCLNGGVSVNSLLLEITSGTYTGYEFEIGRWKANISGGIYTGYYVRAEKPDGSTYGAVNGDIAGIMHKDGNIELTSFLGTQYSGNFYADVEMQGEGSSYNMFLEVYSGTYGLSLSGYHSGPATSSGKLFDFLVGDLEPFQEIGADDLSSFIGTYDWSGTGSGIDGEVYTVNFLGAVTGSLKGVFYEDEDLDVRYIEHAGTAPQIPCEGDFDCDGDVDGSDLAIFAADFGRTDCNQPSVLPCEGDFDGDGDVDGSDLAVFAADFGRTDCPCALNVP